MVLGEAQIAGQVKRSFQAARDAGHLGSVLHRLCSHALHWARRARRQSGLADFAVSVATATVELARRIFGELTGLPVAIVGSGKMGALVLEQFVRARVEAPLVINRTEARARELATRFGGRSRRWNELAGALVAADVVVASTAADEAILTRQDILRVMERRASRPLFLLDLAIPRDIAPEVADVPNVYLYNVDDLQGIVDSNMEKRSQAARCAEQSIDEAVANFEDWLRSRRIGPVLEGMERQIESIVDEELARIAPKLGLEDDEARGKLRGALRRVGKRLLHPCFQELNEGIDPGDEERLSLAQAARRLFDISLPDEEVE
jgi:glutamyl-tRNA reductase